MFVATHRQQIRPPSGGQYFRPHSPKTAKRDYLDKQNDTSSILCDCYYKHGPPDGGRSLCLRNFYNHGPPDGGRSFCLRNFYNHGPPDGGRSLCLRNFYKHGPPDGGRYSVIATTNMG